MLITLVFRFRSDPITVFSDEHCLLLKCLPLIGYKSGWMNIYESCGRYLLCLDSVVYIFSPDIIILFRSVSSIPAKLYSRHLKLHGTVVSVQPDGVIHIVHRPFFNIPWTPTSRGSGTLPVVLPVTHSNQSINWLQKYLRPGASIQFILLGLDPNCSTLVALVFRSQSILFSDVVRALLRDGLCSLAHPSADLLPSARLDGYRTAQMKSVRKQKGIWKKETSEAGILARIKRLFRN
ncbi:hypothetical protein EG68_09934 [Paragonimus skrjabini miyazakii]|uniref:TNase-like domain-containing protein n=1 Tax=Paragonimus skrjabini miyazakii TaxID=59628 RepID=A0A8S9YJW8_9TREM|nr:hypothetical protein EG68_09934 [Paragonimus skrjabini miyazakii]